MRVLNVAVPLFACCVTSCTLESEPQPSAAVAEEALIGHAASNDWAMSTYDVSGSGYNRAEHRLGRGNVADLEEKWRFDSERAAAPVGPIHATPVVANGTTFVGSSTGTFYALDCEGTLIWSVETAPSDPLLVPLAGDRTPIYGAAVLPQLEDTVVFADTAGNVNKLKRANGEYIWSVDISSQTFAGMWGNALALAGDLVLVGLASFEDGAQLVDPDYRCCDHRGGVVALDLETGEERWRYESITESMQGPFPSDLIAQLGGFEQYGPSGGDVWSQPTYDAESKTVYVSTGQLFSRAADGGGPTTYDAIVALDATNGKERWSRQFTPTLDVWRFDITNPDATGTWLDRDMSDSPKIYRLKDGRKVVAAGQKTGEFHVVDAASGALVRTAALIDQATTEGGLQSGGAVAGKVVFQHGLDTSSVAGAPYDGVVLGISSDAREQRWRISLPASPLLAGLAVANGVLYFQSPFEESVDAPGMPATWALYAVHTETGAVLNRLTFPGRALNGPAVSAGRVYAGFGNGIAHGITTTEPAGGVVCLGLPDE
ncbi:MAG TPA: PQQ-binding-like beta-propeller repeat protein [Polyangiales bacterium]|nr:PQQ-binding-like beta-propeller repeat protein [Polyangiales bacterium]